MEEDMKADRTLFQSCKAVIEQSGCDKAKTGSKDKTGSSEDIHTMSEMLECLLDWEAERDDDGE